MYLRYKFLDPFLLTLSDSWDKIRQKWEKENLLKDRMKITLYGSYEPEKEILFLRSLKKFLINNDYTETRLVEDYEEFLPDLTADELSRWSLGYSDVNFFIITKTGNNQGVIRELGFLDDDPVLVFKQAFTTIFEERDEQSHLTTLTLDEIKALDLDVRSYSTMRILEKRMLGEASSYVRKLRSKLRMLGP